MSIGIKQIDVPNNEFGWQTVTQDAGFREINLFDVTKRINILNEDGSEPTAPVLLDGSGSPLTNPSLDNAVYVRTDVYNEKSFSVLPLT